MPDSLLFEQLTSREYEVLNLIAAGRSNQEIADQLVVARSTAKWHVRQIYNKMGVENRRQAIASARAAGLLSDSSAPAAARPKHNLPAQITPFIGRQVELADLDRLLSDTEQRLITILGPGGMGKTRLALAAAEQQVSHFANGIYFVPLASLTDPANLEPIIAEHSGYQLQSDQREPRQQLFDYFREKNLLLVLDNFEHLLDRVQLVADILQAAPGVKVLATSREILGLYGETTYNLSGMPQTSSEDDALQLFAERARRAQPDFSLDGGNVADVTRICQLVGGLPLGIELAAAWLRTLTLGEIADELRQGLNILESRSHSMRVVFERSWHLMTDKQQQAFMRLSVFRGGCTRMAAEAVTGVGLRALQNLVDKSLLWRRSEGRFEMHELLRQYAAEKLEDSGEVESIRDAHVTYYAATLHQRTADLRGPNERDILNDIEGDFDNLHAAWEWAALRRNVDAINQMVGPISYFGWARGLAHMMNDLFGFAAEQLDVDPDDKQRRASLGRVLCAQGGAFADLGQFSQAQAMLQQSLTIARAFGSKADEARCLSELSREMVSALDQAEQYAVKSIALFGELDDRYAQARAYLNLAMITADQRRREEAHEHCLRCIALCRDMGNKSLLAFALQEMANHYYEWGRTEEAQQTRYECLMLFRELNHRHGLKFELTNAAGYAMDAGDLDEGERLIQESLMVNREIDHPFALCYALSRAGVLAEIRGDDAEAERLAQETLIQGKRDPEYLLSQAYIFLAWAFCIQGDFAAAATAEARNLQGLLGNGQTTLLVWTLPSAVWILAARGQVERAIELLGLAVYTRPGEIRRWDMRPYWRELLADIEAELGSDEYQAAFERGKALDLEATINNLISELTDTGS